MDKQSGIFCISLDFELHWGCFESNQLQTPTERAYFTNTKAVIPQILSVFQQNQLHATWATVGMLFLKDEKAWKSTQPNQLPTYKNPNVSSYQWIKNNGFDSFESPFHFAPSLITLIQNTPGQEIGTHTFSHYYCLEPGQTQAQFEADLQTAIHIANQQQITIHSLVFPRNQFNASYLKVCNKLGIQVVRSNPNKWFWKSKAKGSWIDKIVRTADAYVPICDTTVSWQHLQQTTLPFCLPASRFYRAWQKKTPILNDLKLNRILNEMTFAAKHGRYYHLWWHPHNFGHHPQACIAELEMIAEHFMQLKKKYHFQSKNMQEIFISLQHNEC